MSRIKARERNDSEGEFLWLISFSDLMVLLFVLFVVLFSFFYKKLSPKDWTQIGSIIKGEKVTTSLDDIQKKLVDWVVKKNLLDEIEIEQKEDALIIQIKEKILFESGSYVLKEGSQELVSEVALALTKVPAPYRIGIEGHTDNTKLNLENFDGNWQLSAMRALSVLRAFNFSADVLPRVVLLAYGSQKPIVPNDDEKGNAILENKSKNRRVTIRVF